MRGERMRSAPALLALVALSLAVPALAGPPTRAALRKAFEVNRGSVVEVVGPHRSGVGVLVGASGQVLTSVDFVGLERATVRRDGRELPAKVRLANAGLKVALVEIDPPGEYPATAVRLTEPGEGDWLVAISRSRKGALSPEVAQVTRASSEATPFVELDRPLPAGTPLFDDKGRLVAVVVVSGGRGRFARALPLPAVKVELASGTKP